MRRRWDYVILFALLFLQAATERALRPVAVAPAAAPAADLAGAPPQVPAAEAKRIPPPATPAAQLLAHRSLAVPVQGVPRAKVQDNFLDKRGTSRTHKAIDIMAPWGTPVLAADDGVVAKISSNRAGGLAIYQVDGSGQLVYYYAHLAGYADGLHEGQKVARGDVIGYVGTTGNAPESAPHLHFAVQAAVQQGRWWKGEPINPYAALTREEAAAARDSN